MNATDKITCKSCNIEKTASKFYRSRDTRNGYSDICMTCHRKTIVHPAGYSNKEDMARELRLKNDLLIKENRSFELDWTRFRRLAEIHVTNKNSTKQSLQPTDRLRFEMRDKGECYICGSVFHYGSCNIYSGLHGTCKLSHLHHIIPTGSVSDTNIVTLCVHCHQLVHQAMYVSGKWKYTRPT